MPKKNNNNPRGKIFEMILYPDDNEEHKRVLEILKQHYMILGMYHNRDVYEEDNEELGHKKGELKKPHHHVIVKFENARYKNALAKELGVEPNLLQKLGSFRSQVIYLTHRDYPFKAQYKPSEFYGLLIGDAIKCLGDDTPDVQFVEILTYLKGLNRYMSYTDFLIWCSTNGYASTLKRYGFQIRDAFYECQGKYHAQQTKVEYIKRE